ncbi:MAG: flavin reductase family protein [Nitrososphaerota archaeon]
MSLAREVRGDWIHRIFYPVIPSVVTATHSGKVGALLAIPSTLSFKPPMVGVNIVPESNTHKLVESSGMFGVCILSQEHMGRLAKLAEKAAGVDDKLAWAGFEYELGRTVPVPILKDSAAWLECSVEWSREVGDHTLFVGLVRAAYADEDFDGYWQYEAYTPIFYVGRARRFRGSYVSLNLG